MRPSMSLTVISTHELRCWPVELLQLLHCVALLTECRCIRSSSDKSVENISDHAIATSFGTDTNSSKARYCDHSRTDLEPIIDCGMAPLSPIYTARISEVADTSPAPLGKKFSHA